MLVTRNKEERREEDNMGGKRKNGRRKERGKGTYKAAMRTVFFPVILGVVAPMAVMGFLRYSRASPM